MNFKKFLLIISIVFISFFLSCGAAMNYNIKERDARIQDNINNRLISKNFPGIQYIVISADSTIFNYNAGLFDIKAKKPVETKTTMMIYSMTKTFTAAAILQLADKNIISLDDPVSKYVANIPYGNQVTIRHLLSQTSGIPNPIPLKWVHLVEENKKYDEDSALQKLLNENSKLDFSPGKKYAYSNLSYWLLGKIIEKSAGISYSEYMRNNIFQKLNISSNEIDFIIPLESNHSKAYLKKWSFFDLFKSFFIESKYLGEYEDGWLHIKNHYLNGLPFGGIISTARAVSIFLQDQLRNESVLFSKKNKNLFYEQQKNNDGELIEMSLGWHINTIGNNKYYFKEGGGAGFHSEMRIYPSQKIATVVIANNTSFDVKEFLNNVDREFFNK